MDRNVVQNDIALSASSLCEREPEEADEKQDETAKQELEKQKEGLQAKQAELEEEEEKEKGRAIEEEEETGEETEMTETVNKPKIIFPCNAEVKGAATWERRAELVDEMLTLGKDQQYFFTFLQMYGLKRFQDILPPWRVDECAITDEQEQDLRAYYLATDMEDERWESFRRIMEQRAVEGFGGIMLETPRGKPDGGPFEEILKGLRDYAVESGLATEESFPRKHHEIVLDWIKKQKEMFRDFQSQNDVEEKEEEETKRKKDKKVAFTTEEGKDTGYPANLCKLLPRAEQGQWEISASSTRSKALQSYYLRDADHMDLHPVTSNKLWTVTCHKLQEDVLLGRDIGWLLFEAKTRAREGEEPPTKHHEFVQRLKQRRDEWHRSLAGVSLKEAVGDLKDEDPHKTFVENAHARGCWEALIARGEARSASEGNRTSAFFASCCDIDEEGSLGYVRPSKRTAKHEIFLEVFHRFSSKPYTAHCIC